MCSSDLNITELFLALNSDQRTQEDSTNCERQWGQPRQSLDAIIFGIPEVKCKLLRPLPYKKQTKKLKFGNFAKMKAGAPSLCDLKSKIEFYSIEIQVDTRGS